MLTGDGSVSGSPGVEGAESQLPGTKQVRHLLFGHLKFAFSVLVKNRHYES